MSDWHFARPELAATLLRIFDVGITSNIALIAPRRKGKTIFLLRDLAPEAQHHNYIPIYASLWQNMDSPHEGLVYAFDEAIHAIADKSLVKQLLESKIKRASVSNELLGKMDIEFSTAPQKASPKDLIIIDQQVGELVKLAKKQTVLLLVDEVQHLSTSDSFNPLTHALRTILDKRQGAVKTVFTGSSRHYMDLLFNEAKSPFYHFVDQVTFPDLDSEFIEFLRKKLHNDYRLSFPVRSLQKAFEDFDKSPFWIMKMVSQLVTFKPCLQEAVDYTLTMMEASEGFEKLADTMKPIDIIVFKLIYEGQSPFTEDVLERIANETGLKPIPGNIQRSIARLKSLNIISQSASRIYNIEKPGLKKYLESKTIYGRNIP